MRKFITIFLFLLTFLFIPTSCFAKIGVGIGTGKIVVDQKLKSGIIYSLPSLTIVNTGDEDSEYKVSISYHTDQQELMPSSDWFKFKPETFKLKPGESQVVEVKLDLPLRTEPGQYFAYLEGSPVITSEKGKSSVGIAAAAKLYFEIEPSNIFEAIYFKAASIFNMYSPWSERVSITVGVVVLLLVLKKVLNIEISFGKKEDKKKKDE